MRYAVGIVIGASFTKIVNSLVTDIITPIIGAITGGVDFSQRILWLGGGNKEVKTLTEDKALHGAYLGWGSFVQATIDFVIVAAAMFLVIKLMNQAQTIFDRKQAAEPPPAPPEDIQLLREIRDSLARR